MAGSTAVAVVVSVAGVSPIHVLFVASIIGGLATPVGLVMLMLVGADRKTMGADAVRGFLRAAGWFVAGAISLLSIVYLVQQITGGS